MSQRVRTRFAPSPTGYMHIGNLRTALYTYLIAKKNDGDFILRIEDTDQERYVEGAVDVIYDTLRKAGLKWDEGPDVGGEYGPYVQSERMGMFKDYALKLVESGNAYYCFCDKDRLDEVRKIQEASHIPPPGTAVIFLRKKSKKSSRRVYPTLLGRKCRLKEQLRFMTKYMETLRWTILRSMIRFLLRLTVCRHIILQMSLMITQWGLLML